MVRSNWDTSKDGGVRLHRHVAPGPILWSVVSHGSVLGGFSLPLKDGVPPVDLIVLVFGHLFKKGERRGPHYQGSGPHSEGSWTECPLNGVGGRAQTRSSGMGVYLDIVRQEVVSDSVHISDSCTHSVFSHSRLRLVGCSFSLNPSVDCHRRFCH